jgi:hypothetical protein
MYVFLIHCRATVTKKKRKKRKNQLHKLTLIQNFVENYFMKI